MSDKKANELFAEFVRNKIRERVKDPVVAEKLCPRIIRSGPSASLLESGYYEQFNRENVLLVDLRKSPIERITPKGIKTGDAEYELDVIIYATGFDAVTGPLTRIDFRGEGGISLKDKWAEGPRTYLGMQTAGFPEYVHPGRTAQWIHLLQYTQMYRAECRMGNRLPSLPAREGLHAHRGHARGGRGVDRSCQ